MILMLTLALTLPSLADKRDAPRPNIMIILVDDMGFSDLGCYGGEIPTPNIDALGYAGLRFKTFYNTGRCCPTRASLLTGLHPHQAGIGHMTESPTRKSELVDDPYQGYLNKRCVTIAEVLQKADYHTFIVGKWHLGYHRKDTWPLQRGFDRFYGTLAGACHYFNPEPPRGLSLDNEPVDPEPTREDEPYYVTDAFTDYACRFIEEADREDDKPFFMYLSYNAPHWPLHAKKKDIAKHQGKYMLGWDKLKVERHERLKELGIIDPSWVMAPHEGPAWDSLTVEQKKIQDLRMAAYAACMDSLDQNIGILINTLKELDRFDNTLIFFLTDNGACAEGGNLGRGSRNQFFEAGPKTYHTLRYGRCWANASATPFRRYKSSAHEGGIATPLIAHWPEGIKPRTDASLVDHHGYLPDLMPTCIELAGAIYPETYKDRETITPMQGNSLVPLLRGGDEPIHTEPLAWEHQGNRALRHGRWKISWTRGINKWELYDMVRDGTEMNDLAEEMPEKRKELAVLWQAWADRVGVK
ncbi:MAG: arylsulfatase [Planctomycetota bacterium]